MKAQNEKRTDKKDFHQSVTDQIIEILESSKKLKSSNPWFIADSSNDFFAYNPSNERYYTGGLNNFMLNFFTFYNSYPLNRWVTFNQGKNAGGRLKKGSKAIPVFFSDTCYFDSEGNYMSKYVKAVLKSGTHKQKLEVIGRIESGDIIERWYDKYYNVFNVAQFENLPESYTSVLDAPKNDKQINVLENAEDIISSTGAIINYWDKDSACYSIKSDEIYIPKRDYFKSTEGFYGVLFHELAHWTGAEPRLNRKGISEFKDNEPSDYAFEELVAELSSAISMARIGISKNINNNASYINSWLKALNNDKKFIFKASALADKASSYLFRDAQASYKTA